VIGSLGNDEPDLPTDDEEYERMLAAVAQVSLALTHVVRQMERIAVALEEANRLKGAKT
jgi:hypothetical protein